MLSRFTVLDNNVQCDLGETPCRLCLQNVTKKTGIQCSGSCKKWAHYKCLDYTPGKISDIKAGIIKVVCPCPDCETTQPKEYLTNPPYTCSNKQCPANLPPGPPMCPTKACSRQTSCRSIGANTAESNRQGRCVSIEKHPVSCPSQKGQYPRPPTPPALKSSCSRPPYEPEDVCSPLPPDLNYPLPSNPDFPSPSFNSEGHMPIHPPGPDFRHPRTVVPYPNFHLPQGTNMNEPYCPQCPDLPCSMPKSFDLQPTSIRTKPNCTPSFTALSASSSNESKCVTYRLPCDEAEPKCDEQIKDNLKQMYDAMNSLTGQIKRLMTKMDT